MFFLQNHLQEMSKKIPPASLTLLNLSNFTTTSPSKVLVLAVQIFAKLPAKSIYIYCQI